MVIETNHLKNESFKKILTPKILIVVKTQVYPNLKFKKMKEKS